MRKKWTCLIAFFLSVMMVAACLPASASEADAGAESASIQTYATPEEATAAGKVVKYFGFNTARYWESTRFPCALHLYQPESGGASAETSTALVLDTNGVDDGAAYVIIANPDSPTTNMGVLHIVSDATNQCRGAAHAATVSHLEHLFVFENVEGGWAIRAAGSDPAKYLSLDPSGSQRVFKTEKTIFNITPASAPNDGSYYIWTVTEKPVDVVTPPPALETAYEYKLDTDGIDSGETYVIYSNGSDPSKNRILYHTGTGKTNHTACDNSGTLVDVMQLSSAYPASRQLWVITAVDGVANGYTVQSVDSGRYLALSSASTNGSDTSETAVTLTIATDPDDGTITISTDDYKLGYNANGSFSVVDAEGTAASLRLFKKTEVVSPTLARTAFTGTSEGQPMVKADTHGLFRIPSLITLDNGWLMAASDIRWLVTRDSPANLDTIVSISKDGGENWSWEVINYFADQAADYSNEASASFIDPSVVQTSDGKIWMIVAALPAYGGLAASNRLLSASDPASKGFDDQGRMLVGHITDVTAATYFPASGDYFYDYYVDLYGTDSITANDGAPVTVEGETVTLYPICKSDDDSTTGYYVDIFANTYYDYGAANGGIQPILAWQQGSAKLIHNNLFYLQSEWKVPCTFYLQIRSAEIKGDSLEWSDPFFVDVKRLREESDAAGVTNERFVGVCPGRGTVKQLSDGTERIIFPVYDNASGTEKASTVYSDDHGVTWNRGERIPNGEADKSSESQIVVLPVSDDPADGAFLRIYSRNAGGKGKYISYADSTDNGVTWTAEKFDLDLYCGHDTMVSFINIDGYVIGPDGKAYGNLILASYPMGDVNGTQSVRRTNGTVRIGSYDTESGTVTWLNRAIYGGVGIRYPFNFTYSCLTQLQDGNGDAANSFAILYEDETRVNNAANLEIVFDTFTAEDILGAGWSWRPTLDGYVEPTPAPVGDDVYTPGKAAENGKVVKYLALIDGDSSSRGWGAAGSSARIELYEAAQIDSSWAVTLDTDGVGAGNYVINFNTGDGRNQAVMHYANGASSQCKEAGVAHDASDADLLHLFAFAEAAGSSYSNAFTIKAHSADKYLSLDSSGSNLAFKDTPTTFYITPTDTLGSYYIWTAEDPTPIIAPIESGENGPSDPDTSTTTTTNPDGSTTTTVTDNKTGTVTETTEKPDGTVETKETLKDGTVTETTEKPDGSSESVKTEPDGTVTETSTDAEGGKVEKVTTHEEDVTITVTDAEGEELAKVTIPAEIPEPETRFVDVPEGHWADEAIHNMAALELVKGEGSNTFNRDGDMTRGALATVLSRLSNGKEGLGSSFADVDADQWYADGIAWAAKTGVVTGYSETEFGPNDPITREQLAVMLCRYARLLGMDTAADTASLDGFTDGSSTDGWAADSIAWCVDNGIINGMGDGTLAPTATATRAQVAVMLQRFMDLLK